MHGVDFKPFRRFGLSGDPSLLRLVSPANRHTTRLLTIQRVRSYQVLRVSAVKIHQIPPVTHGKSVLERYVLVSEADCTLCRIHLGITNHKS
jgi:hypothetical protein